MGPAPPETSPLSRHEVCRSPASPVKLKLGLALLDGLVGEAVIDGATGATVSTVQVSHASAPVIPAASVAFTCKVCEPFATAVYALRDLQVAKAPLPHRQANL